MLRVVRPKTSKSHGILLGYQNVVCWFVEADRELIGKVKAPPGLDVMGWYADTEAELVDEGYFIFLNKKRQTLQCTLMGHRKKKIQLQLLDEIPFDLIILHLTMTCYDALCIQHAPIIKRSANDYELLTPLTIEHESKLLYTPLVLQKHDPLAEARIREALQHYGNKAWFSLDEKFAFHV